MRLALQINARDFVIASLQGPFQFMYPYGTEGFINQKSKDVKIGFAWSTRWKSAESIQLYHRNLLKLIKEVTAEYEIDRRRIFLLGFSQSVALNYRFVFTHPDLVRGVIGVCGGIPGDWVEAPYRRSETDVLHIATDQDPYYPVERARQFEALLADRCTSVALHVLHDRHRFPRRAIPRIAAWLRERK